MKISTMYSKVRQFSLLVISVFLLTNCQKPPTPEFSYSPLDNPETGDTIHFINESIEAQSYNWDLGYTISSTDENPFAIYDETGAVDVTLTATNDAGSESITKTITINDPTILELFIYQADDTTAISDCEVWVYDNESDFNESFETYKEPQFFDVTDDEGFTMFSNLEAIVYYIVAIKELEDGIWFVGGNTKALEQNEVNPYLIPCTYYANESKKSIKKRLTSPNIGLLKEN